MNLSTLFAKPVDRPIEGVIKADDRRHLEVEVEEFVITAEIGRGLDTLLERYQEETSANGVWISGFFGSGKSHLLKILSLLLDATPMPSGKHAVDTITEHLDDEILSASLKKACSIPAQSILFNIDQQANHIGGDGNAAVLEVFVKVLNRLRGYDPMQGYIAEFEYHLDRDAQLQEFKDTYQDVNGRTWENDRDAIGTIRKKAFGKAYAKHFDVSEEEGIKTIGEVRKDYTVSIESFAEQVKTYIDSQGDDFRLNFFVDEVGQFIGENTQLMLNLQTIAETLSTICDGRAWVFVTSQGDLDKVLGDMGGHTSQDFTKIQGRFKTRLTLTSADVKEVIQKRLLAKKEDEPESLTSIYDQEKDNLVTLYRFSDDCQQFKGWRGSDEFCDFYPFHPYQFDLFQRALEQLSKHDMFTGRHTAVGERSMLEVFQSVVKSLKDQSIGSLAPFDLMFDGISATLKGDVQTAIIQAGQHFDDPLSLRILKTLFLLKWVKTFTSTPRNVAILLIDTATPDIAAHEKSVEANLRLLEAQSLLQRNGDVYEFLTDTEKDIETEIKQTDVDDSEVTKLLSDVIFSDTLRDPKIRCEANGQDYAYTRKLDDQIVGREHEFSINIITPEHPNHSDEATLAAQGTGKPELMLVLPADDRVLDEARLYLKTQKYIQQNTGSGVDESRRAIMTERGAQNNTRRAHLKDRCSELLSRSPAFLNGSKVEGVSYAEPRNRVHKLAQDLIAFAFPNLRMLRGSYDEALLRKTLTDQDDLLTGGQQPLSEAENELLTYVRANQTQGERTTVDEIVRQFARRPCGWYSLAVTCLLARLFRMGKVDFRSPDPLDASAALSALSNTRQHATIRVQLQQQFDPASINALKRFHHEFFDQTNPGTDARSVGEATLNAFAQKAQALDALLQQKPQYAFLAGLAEPVNKLKSLADKDANYLLSKLGDFDNDLLELKDDLLDPVLSFMNGSQRKAYDEAIAFLRDQEANFGDIPAEELQPLRDLAAAEHPYRGNAVPAAKTACDGLQTQIDSLLEAQRQSATASLAALEEKIQVLPDFAKLDAMAQAQVLSKTASTRASIADARFLTAIRDSLNRYRNNDYPSQLAMAAELAKPTGGDETPKTTYIPASSLTAKCTLPYISSEADLDQWLKALRETAMDELKQGKRISL
jgi:hypothetical protein